MPYLIHEVYPKVKEDLAEASACESRASRLAEKKAVDFETATGSPFQLFKGAGKSQQLIHQRAGKAGVPEIVRMQEVCFGIMEVYGLGI